MSMLEPIQCATCNHYDESHTSIKLGGDRRGDLEPCRMINCKCKDFKYPEDKIE